MWSKDISKLKKVRITSILTCQDSLFNGEI